MTAIQDMTSTQRHSWLVLLADGAVFTWFWQKMTVGLSLRPIEYDIAAFGKIVVGIIVLTVVLHVAISIVFDVVAKPEKSKRDERDIAIERRGAFWGYRILQTGIGVVTVSMLISAMAGENYTGPIVFASPVQIIFGLIVTSYVADLVKHAVMIHGYES